MLQEIQGNRAPAKQHRDKNCFPQTKSRRVFEVKEAKHECKTSKYRSHRLATVTGCPVGFRYVTTPPRTVPVTLADLKLKMCSAALPGAERARATGDKRLRVGWLSRPGGCLRPCRNKTTDKNNIAFLGLLGVYTVVEEKGFPDMKLCFVKGQEWEWGKLTKEILSRFAWENKEAGEKTVRDAVMMPLLKAQLYTASSTVAAIKKKIIAMAFLKLSVIYTSLPCLLSSWQYYQ
ncbi:hypothetical protein MDA_GLEAN10017465 [Myotis davidii]|uniref:Uncharacterized protein n=1 Tax=Myotis davidii TaxID=225400 RepID=L5LAE1_MYODS|nr:hypothetical protein MDA_GLEAN10017465 [Myotis davidii]